MVHGAGRMNRMFRSKQNETSRVVNERQTTCNEKEKEMRTRMSIDRTDAVELISNFVDNFKEISTKKCLFMFLVQKKIDETHIAFCQCCCNNS